MTLEDIIKEIRTTEENPRSNSEYNSTALTRTSDYIQSLSIINPQTIEGLEEYEKLTGLSIKGVPETDARLKHKQVTTGIGIMFGEYLEKHFPTVVDEIDKKIQPELAYIFCPETNSETSPKEYEITRGIIGSAKKTIETIQKDPDTHISNKIKEAPEYMKEIVGLYPEEALQIDTQNAKRSAYVAIEQYDAGKFISEIYVNLKSLQSEHEKKINALTEKEKERRDQISFSYDAKQTAEALAEIRTEEAKLKEEEKKFKIIPEFMDTIAKYAVNEIKKKEESKNSEP